MNVQQIIHEFRLKMIDVIGVNDPIIAIKLSREAQGRLDWELLEVSRYMEIGATDKSRVTIFEGIKLDSDMESE